MPWNVSDVDRHKKGLSPSQKKEWVKIANGIYDECLSKGGTDKTCAPKAIRIANSKFSEGVSMITKNETKTVKKSALCFNEIEAVRLAADDGGKIQLFMIAYSGKIIKEHWYWGDLAIDVEGLKAAKNKIPVLEDHYTDKKVGFGKMHKTDNYVVEITDATFLDTPFAQDFIKNSQEGFPYEASMYCRPSKIQRLMEKEEAEVNGYKMKGPGTIWRESVLKECSVCVFGSDSGTKSAALAEDEEVLVEIQEVEKTTEKEDIMDLEKLKTEHPALYEEIISLGKAATEAVFLAERTASTNTITTLTAENTQLKTEKEQLSAVNVATEKRILALEKVNILQKEQDIKLRADGIVTAMLVAQSEIPTRLHEKIRKQINHQDFVKEGVLDEASFSAAVATELKDWLPVEGEESPILGMGAVRTTSTLSEEALVARMVGHVQKSVETSVH